MARLHRRQPSNRGDLYQRQWLIRFLTSPHPVQATAVRSGTEYDTHLAQRCRCCRLLLAHCRGDRDEVLLMGDNHLRVYTHKGFLT